MGIVNGHYRYTQDLLSIESKHVGRTIPSSAGVRGPAPLNLEALAVYLHCHPDQQFAAYLYRGLAYGFHIGFDHTCVSLRSSLRNHPSSNENPMVIATHIRQELASGRLVGLVHCPMVPKCMLLLLDWYPSPVPTNGG